VDEKFQLLFPQLAEAVLVLALTLEQLVLQARVELEVLLVQ
jgi:hypothetical protein